MKTVFIVRKILTDKVYGLIIEGAYEYKKKKDTTEHFDELFKEVGGKNPLFWPKLFEAFWEYGNKSGLSDDDMGALEYLQGRGERFTSDVERDAFIYELVTKRMEEELEKRSFRNRKFTLSDLPFLDNILLELRKLNKLRGKFYRPQIDVLTDWLLRLAFEGGFSKHDIAAIKIEDRKAVVKVLLKHYFSIRMFAKENNRNEEVFFATISKSGDNIDYIRLYPNTRGNSALEVFKKGYSYYAQNTPDVKAGFKKFQQYEKNRFKGVLQCLSEIDDEHALVSNYLSRVGAMTEYEMTKKLKLEYSFGFSRIDHRATFYRLLDELTEKINFLWFDDKGKGSREEAIENAVFALTTENYKKEKREVRFCCETTTVAYVLNAINDKFKPLAFNSYVIGKSGLFMVPTVKKPSEQPDKRSAFKFKPLKRDNVAKSLLRFAIYRSEEDRAEYLHYQQIQPIFKRFDFIIK